MGDEYSEKHEKARNPHLRAGQLTRYLLALGLASPVFEYGFKVTDGFSLVPKNAKNVSVVSDEATRAETLEELRQRFVEVLIGYQKRDQLDTFDVVKQGFLRGRDENYEVLEEARSNTGFYGLLLRNKTTGETTLNYGGMNIADLVFDRNKSIAMLKDLMTIGPMNPEGRARFIHKWARELHELGEMMCDVDDAAWLSTGGMTSQVEEAIAFAKKAEDTSKAMTGHGVTFMVSHSNGANLQGFVKGLGICPTAKAYFYDGPGIKNTTVRTIMELSRRDGGRGLSEGEVEANLRFNSASFIFTHNLVNTMGQQIGRKMAVDNHPAQSDFFPGGHVMNDEFVKKFEEIKTLVECENENENSRAARWALGFLIFAALETTVLFSPTRFALHHTKKAAGHVARYHRQWRDGGTEEQGRA